MALHCGPRALGVHTAAATRRWGALRVGQGAGAGGGGGVFSAGAGCRCFAATPRRWRGSSANAGEVEARQRVSSSSSGTAPPKWIEHERVSRWSLGLVRGLSLDWQSGMIYGGSMLIAVWVIIKIFIEPLKHDAVGHTVGVATKVINEGEVRTNALTLSRNVVRDIFNDEACADEVCSMLKRMCDERAVELSLVDFLRTALNRDDNYATVRDWVAGMLADDSFGDIIADAAAGLVVEISRNDAFVQRCICHIAEAWVQAVADDAVQRATADAVPPILARAGGVSDPVTQSERLERLEQEQRQLRRTLIAARERLTRLKLDMAQRRAERLEALLQLPGGQGADDGSPVEADTP